MKYIIILLIILSCKSERQTPEGIPQNASYDKKRNLYTLVENGLRKQYTQEGKLYSECEIESDGRENGTCKTFLPDTGQILSEGKYILGERDGIWTWNFPDGKIYYKLSFAHDKKRKVWLETNLLGNEHGEYSRYYQDGTLEEKGYYDTGLKTGKWIKFYPNGKPEYKGEYFKDKRVFEWLYFYPSGVLEAKEIFSKEGKLLERKTFYPDGKEACIQREGSELNCAK